MTNQQNETLQAALKYASWGWAVLPLLPDSKIPLKDSHGVKDATTDPKVIRSWFEKTDNLNIGVAAGEQSGIIVFDIDPRNGGDGSWESWQEQNGNVPDCAMQMTAGGGEHYICHYTSEIKSCKLAAGIDLLTDGRYFVVSPSVVNGRIYEWEWSGDPDNGAEPFSMPSKWLDAYKQNHNGNEKKRSIEDKTELIKGNRNEGLTALGGAMRNYGMTQAEIFAALSVANDTRCEVPLPSSELSQIARSVCRYDFDSDVASSTALGSQAANNLLAGIIESQKDYYLTSGTALMSQPSPIEWAVKHWIPSRGTWMIYGPSGVGKSFLALSIACSIAHGMQWNGNRTKQGYAIYLAGEGNYGMRSRIASWAKYAGVSHVDNLLVSNRGIDFDTPNAAAQVIDAINEVLPEGGTVKSITVDTLNNHMTGDENSAQDTRLMLKAIEKVALAFDTNAGIVHHTGNSEHAQHRGRGSSAIKAALDSQILLKEENDVIKVECTKMKDGKEPEPFYGDLEEVDLGWVDEDGERQPGAVFVPVDYTPPTPDKNHEIKKQFESAWIYTHMELDTSGRPYVTKEALQRWYEEKAGNKPNTARTYVGVNNKGKPVNKLIQAQWIAEEANGFSVVDAASIENLMRIKNSMSK